MSDDHPGPGAVPVGFIPSDDAQHVPAEGIALCLSGGGYRAMLFHVGVLWRVNEVGLLPRLDRISSVSGGSITAGYLGLRWHALDFNAAGVAQGFGPAFVDGIRAMADETVDVGSILGGMLWFGTIADKVAGHYEDHLYGAATLQDLPPWPRFVINATSLQSGALWRFSRPYMWDWRVGKVSNPTVRLSHAVAASSAFPPVLSPFTLDLGDFDFEPGTGHDLQKPPYTEEAVLSDGGVYDNLGLETAFKRYGTILVSDAGGQIAPEPDPHSDWARQSKRVLDVIDNQVRSLRKRQLISAYKARHRLIAAGEAPDGDTVRRLSRQGTYWGIRSNIAHYGLPDALPAPHEKTMALAREATRLKSLPAVTQERLINWGYAICDTALRKHWDPTLPAPAGFPYAGGVG